MVRTRLRARQEATGLAPVTNQRTGKPEKIPVREEGRSCEVIDVAREALEHPPPTVEELALRSFSKMKKRISKELNTSSPEVESSTEEEEEDKQDEKIDSQRKIIAEGQPTIIRLETTCQAASKKQPADKFTGELASSLQPEINSELYFSCDPESLLWKVRGNLGDEGDADKELMQRSVITADFEKREAVPPMYQSRYALERMRKAQRDKSAGRGWFDLPATQLTPELTNDLKILRLRNALDPTHHYRANDSKQPPKCFQIGRVISGPAEYYSSRVPRKQRKRTIVEELLADEQLRRFQKRKFQELGVRKMSGRGRLQQIKHRRWYKK